MRNLILPVLTVLAFFHSCAPTRNHIVPDEIAKEIFSPDELKGIEKMITYVDRQVSEITNETDINESYHTYFNELSFDVFPALVKDTAKFKFLETIDEEAFSTIWRMDDHKRMVKTKDTVLTDLHGFKSLELNYNGKYLNYLKEIGKTDKRYAEIYESIEIAGDLSPSAVAWFRDHHQELDFTLFKDRLWATVLLLRMGDPLDEKVERYLKNQKPNQ
jgi:hypothetical protein